MADIELIEVAHGRIAPGEGNLWNGGTCAKRQVHFLNRAAFSVGLSS